MTSQVCLVILPITLVGNETYEAWEGSLTLHVLARLLAAATVGLILLAAPAASAQVEGCVTDPASCVPPAPDPDPCVSDPASCLPSAPPGDACAQDPASCLPSAPDPGACVNDPTSCVPGPPDPGTCVQDPGSCLSVGGLGPGTSTGDRHDPSRAEPSRGEDDGTGGAPVVGGITGGRGPGGQGPTDRAPRRPGGPARPSTQVSLVAEAGRDPEAALGGLGGLAEALRDFAFPIVLLVGVSLFLSIQSQIDRKDPKLTMAPVSSRHDVVEFM